MQSASGKRKQWSLVTIVCFTEPNIDGEYLTEGDYSFLFGLGPDIQRAFENVDEVIREVREAIADRIENVKSQPT